MSNPGKQPIKWILKYLKGTFSLCLCFGDGKLIREGFTDVDMAGDIDSMLSTSGYLMTFAGGAISWQSRL